MATDIGSTIKALGANCSDNELRALHRACAWNVPDFDDVQAALALGQPSVLGVLLSQSKLPAAARPELATRTLLWVSKSPLDYARPDKMAEVLLSSGAEVNGRNLEGRTALENFSRQLGQIEAEEDHAALSAPGAKSSGGGAKLRRLWDTIATAGGDVSVAHASRMSAYHDKTRMLVNLQKRRESEPAPALEHKIAARMR